jgi:hypothetical protein
MAKIEIIQSNLTSGELSPRVALGRMDVAKFQNGSRRQENVELTVQGGARRRRGTRLVAETKASGVARLIEFTFNRDQAYMIEMGDGYMRFIKDREQIESSPGVPYEIVSPYTAAMLDDVEFVQGADTMFLVHPEVTPYRLQRFGDTNWRLLAVPFTVEPFAELGVKPATALTVASLGVGTGVNFNAVGSFFPSDKDRDIVASSGMATVTAYVDANNVTCEIKSAFPSLVTASGGWTIQGSPQTNLTPSVAGPVDTGVLMSLSAGGWRPGTAEVGKFIRINGGLVKVLSYNSPTDLTGRIIQVMSSVVPAIPNSWSLESSIWGGANGYPRAVTLHEQRLHLAGSPGFPQTLSGSRIGDYLNFELGTADDDAFSYELSTSQVAPIQHLAQVARLMVMTSSNEMSVRGGVEKTITPTNIQKKDESTAGSNAVRPVKIGNEILFVQRAGRKVRAIGYRYDIDGFSSPDRTVFSEHITESGVIDMAFQQEPDAMLFCVRADGVMAVCAYDVDQEVVGWGRWITQGLYESVAGIPTATAEDIYTVVKRTINGVEKRFIEVGDPDVALDLAYVGTSVPGQTVWTGLDHLEGMTVQVLADGAYMGEFEVVSGDVTLPRAAFEVQIGLSYTALIEPLQIEIAANGTTIQGKQISVNEVVLRVLDTKQMVINDQLIDPRTFGADLLDQPPPDFAGDIRVATFTDEIYKVRQVITAPLPLPFHLLNVIRSVTVNG